MKTLMQRTLDQDLKEIEVPERIVPYSDRVFRQVAVEWLAATDQVSNSIKCRLSFSLMSLQPIQALEHAKFRELINIVLETDARDVRPENMFPDTVDSCPDLDVH